MSNQRADIEKVLEFRKVPARRPEAIVSAEYDESIFLDPPGCGASFFKEVQEWDDASLRIKWKSREKEFDVTFKGQGTINLTIENLLSNAVPLHIAQSSSCECGESLQLGDYQVFTSKNDFSFEGTFFCRKCKANTLAVQSGLRHFISTWFKGLKRVDIKATGVAIERE